MELDAGDVVLSITWHPGGLGGRSGVARVSHLDGRDDKREMNRLQAQALASSCFGATMARARAPRPRRRVGPGRAVDSPLGVLHRWNHSVTTE